MKQIPQLKISIRNQSDEEAVIDIDGDIGWSFDKWINGEEQTNTKEGIKKQLKAISEIKSKKIIVNISSFGGFVDDGLAIHDMLAMHPAEIETRVTGLTASAATLPMQSANKGLRKMSDNALLLAHKSLFFAIGNANDLQAALDDSKTVDERIANLYAKRSGKDVKVFQDLMNENNGDGKWIDAKQAKELGLIDEIIEPSKAAAAVDVRAFAQMGLPIPENYEKVICSDPPKPADIIPEVKPAEKKEEVKTVFNKLKFRQRINQQLKFKSV